MPRDVNNMLGQGQWVPVLYGNGNYFVNGKGDVFSKVTSRNLRPYTTVDGYLRVNLCQDGKQKNFRVHRLVAEAFIGPEPIGHQVSHNNGIPSDNRVENLSYKTRVENAMDKEKHGTALRGERHPSSKLTWDQVIEIREKKMSQNALARKFGISPRNIRDIQNRTTWKVRS